MRWPGGRARPRCDSPVPRRGGRWRAGLRSGLGSLRLPTYGAGGPRRQPATTDDSQDRRIRGRRRRGRGTVDLFEYQARDLFAEPGVPVLEAAVAETPQEARAGAERLGGGTVVVKAQ